MVHIAIEYVPVQYIATVDVSLFEQKHVFSILQRFGCWGQSVLQFSLTVYSRFCSKMEP